MSDPIPTPAPTEPGEAVFVGWYSFDLDDFWHRDETTARASDAVEVWARPALAGSPAPAERPDWRALLVKVLEVTEGAAWPRSEVMAATDVRREAQAAVDAHPASPAPADPPGPCRHEHLVWDADDEQFECQTCGTVIGSLLDALALHPASPAPAEATERAWNWVDDLDTWTTRALQEELADLRGQGIRSSKVAEILRVLERRSESEFPPDDPAAGPAPAEATERCMKCHAPKGTPGPCPKEGVYSGDLHQWANDTMADTWVAAGPAPAVPEVAERETPEQTFARQMAAVDEAERKAWAATPGIQIGATLPDEASRIIAGRVRTLRKRAGLTQVDLAARLDVTATCVSYWESHDRMVKVDDLPKLARGLDVTIADLLPSEFLAARPSSPPVDPGTDDRPKCPTCWRSGCDGTHPTYRPSPVDPDPCGCPPDECQIPAGLTRIEAGCRAGRAGESADHVPSPVDPGTGTIDCPNCGADSPFAHKDGCIYRRTIERDMEAATGTGRFARPAPPVGVPEGRDGPDRECAACGGEREAGQLLRCRACAQSDRPLPVSDAPSDEEPKT